MTESPVPGPGTSREARPPAHKIVRAVLRAAGTTAALVVIYYLLPLDRSSAGVAVTMLVTGLLMRRTAQHRSTATAPDSRQPGRQPNAQRPASSGPRGRARCVGTTVTSGRSRRKPHSYSAGRAAMMIRKPAQLTLNTSSASAAVTAPPGSGPRHPQAGHLRVRRPSSRTPPPHPAPPQAPGVCLLTVPRTRAPGHGTRATASRRRPP